MQNEKLVRKAGVRDVTFNTFDASVAVAEPLLRIAAKLVRVGKSERGTPRML